MTGSTVNLSIDLAADPIIPTVDSHYHRFMLSCPYGDQTRQNETYTNLYDILTVDSLETRRWAWVSSQSPFHGLRVTII